ncbi:MAG: SprB repeat-containing protein [Cyclobacteriaceae bacterium]
MDTAEGCREIVLTVSHDGTGKYDLSHFTVDIPCGEILDLTNSKGWKQEYGKDPTTGLQGFKIDDISNFGGRKPQQFNVSFKLCDGCQLEQLIVGYKAGRCVNYDSLSLPIDTPTDPRDSVITDPGDSVITNPGDSTITNPGDSTTCSTLLATIQKTNVSCYGAQEGRLAAVITDGEEPFSYRWSNGATTAAIEQLAVGEYSVTITDANGNVLTLTDHISSPEEMSVSAQTVNPSCSGVSNGSIDLSITGGVGPYAVSWSNGSQEEDQADLAAGTYLVYVADANGCTTISSFVLTNATSLSQNVQLTHATCGQSNGAINITPSGGVAPYSYLWSNGATTEDVHSLPAGSYTVKVTDAVGCSRETPYVLRNESPVRIQYAVTPTSCLDDASGSIVLTVSGGTAPYTYQWEDGPTTKDRTGLSAGLYRINVTDNTGCFATAVISLFKKSFQINSEVVQPTCATGTGSITINPIDGVAPYTYSWSTGETGNSISELSAGLYSITITDASGCSRTFFYSITAPAAIGATVEIANGQCGAEGAFNVNLAVSGGKAPYTFLWSNGATSEDLSNVNTGTYTVLITDANECTATKEAVVEGTDASWSCFINPPTAPFVCSSVGNVVTTSIEDADVYAWTLTSSDGSWRITAGTGMSSVVITAGNANSSATLSLQITKDGCTKSCTYEITAGGCIEKDNTGGGDPQSGDPCSGTTVVTNPDSDPTPGEEEEADEETEEENADGETEEEVEGENGDDGEEDIQVEAYPNPFEDRLTFEWKAKHDDFVHVEILDVTGQRVSPIFNGPVKAGERYTREWTPPASDNCLYIYRYISGRGEQVTKKLLRKN